MVSRDGLFGMIFRDGLHRMVSHDGLLGNPSLLKIFFSRPVAICDLSDTMFLYEHFVKFIHKKRNSLFFFFLFRKLIYIFLLFICIQPNKINEIQNILSDYRLPLSSVQENAHPNFPFHYVLNEWIQTYWFLLDTTHERKKKRVYFKL